MRTQQKNRCNPAETVYPRLRERSTVVPVVSSQSHISLYHLALLSSWERQSEIIPSATNPHSLGRVIFIVGLFTKGKGRGQPKKKKKKICQTKLAFRNDTRESLPGPWYGAFYLINRLLRYYPSIFLSRSPRPGSSFLSARAIKSDSSPRLMHVIHHFEKYSARTH
ncbi:hypothetical protein BO86DRAFT_111938 [Aspergillus japonicus CBS 114.51]|uniref:Uncharacterized protein n=1 Tax=Aspergillus japonicus CBS 114.51 TaxID=1448312 RepID=A0A8T8XEX1_ASPJA|nr:hypothetical protein BO86DRAFT_111938 [Aspergillus japonicus CBS 114.51]RAH86508.1 hypothetical protein BO86DRAFT_111938 [Aspergillus japonicus CBS 114.51]